MTEESARRPVTLARPAAAGLLGGLLTLVIAAIPLPG
jgi:hypothetical protein